MGFGAGFSQPRPGFTPRSVHRICGGPSDTGTGVGVSISNLSCQLRFHKNSITIWSPEAGHGPYRRLNSMKNYVNKLNVLLTVHLGIFFVNNELDAQYFMYVYFYSLHVSDSYVPIIRRINCINRHQVCVTLCRWPAYQTVFYTDWHIPDVALIQ